MLDFICIGLGPFNLSLVSLLHNKSTLHYKVFEQKAQFDWHSGIQLPNSQLQVPFIADLVSMVDPTSPFSFLNYLVHHQRLYKFYFLEQSHIPRCEYNHYCQWVAQQLDCIQYQSRVIDIEAQTVGFKVLVEQQGVQHHYSCRHLVIGSGHSPFLPECLIKIQQQRPQQCLHAAQYMDLAHTALHGDVLLLGSGQSAAEVFSDLFEKQSSRLQDQTNQPFALHWLTRSPGFFPMEYTALALEHFSPDYIRYFYQLPQPQKQQQLQQQTLLYKGISAQTLAEIYQKLYQRSAAGQELQTYLHSQCDLKNAEILQDKIQLFFQHRVTSQSFQLNCDFLVAATGYYTPNFSFMQQLTPYIELDDQQHWKITQDYRIVHDLNGHIFVQNQEMHSHGVGTPDLGLGAYRAATIINQLVAHTLYPLNPQPQSFQDFDLKRNPKICFIEQKPYKAPHLPSKTLGAVPPVLKKIEVTGPHPHVALHHHSPTTQRCSALLVYGKS